MREITDSDEIYNGMSADESSVIMSLEEAKVISRALVFVNNKNVGELERILHSDESDYLKEAAQKKYQEDTAAMTKLHMALAEIFPELRQGGPSVS